MNKKFFTLLFISFGGTVFGQQLHPLHKINDFENQQKWVDSIYSGMTLKEKVGQLFMVDLFSSDPKAKVDRVKRLISEQHIGGIIFSKGGPGRQAKITNDFQKIAKIPLMIAMDAEWGLAMRLDSTYAFPWNMTLGAIEDISLIYKVGKRIGEHNKRLGVHMNFAPVLDINTNPENPIIGNRSFGEDRDNVTKKAAAFMQGMQSVGVLASGKHFPGHGDTDSDSHKTLPTVSFSEKRIDSIELYPYKYLFTKGLASVMIAHLNVPSLEPRQNFPSSLSSAIVTDLLKNTLGFQGLIFTDALNMKGVSAFNNPGEVDLAAFQAGNDVLLISEDIPKAHQLIVDAYKEGSISEERLAHSVKKILYAKYKVGLNKYKPINTTFLYEELNSVLNDELYEELMDNAITVIKNKDGILPIRELQNKKFAYVNFGDASGSDFLKQLQKYAPVDWVKATTLDELILKLKAYDCVIVGFHKSNENPWKGYKMTQKEQVWIYEIARTNQVILNIFTRPYALLDLKATGNFESVVVSYQNSKIAQEVSAQLIFGAREAKGKLPVTAGENFPVNSKLETKSLNRLSYGSPESVGFNSEKLKKVDSLAQLVVTQSMAPGVQVLIAKQGKVVFQKNYGYHTQEKKEKVADEDIYDVASLTKILATVPILIKLADQGVIDLEFTLSDLLPEYRLTNKAHITLKELLSHFAGLKAWIPFYRSTLDKETKKPSSTYYKTTPEPGFTNKVTEKLYARNDLEDSIHKIILESDVAQQVKYLYSDLPYYMLKKYIEKHYGKPLERVIQEEYYEPLGTYTMGYLPTERMPLENIVPTEIDTDFRMQKIHGYVHDQGAAMMDGVSGHAGVFANANDVAKIMQMYVWRGFYGGKRYFNAESLDLFNTCYYCDKQVRRGIGFDKPQLGVEGPTCGCVSMTSFGHSGFTGTYTWADPENEVVYVFLSNRTYPDVNNRKLISSNIRTKIQQAIYDAIDF
ncbi:MAG: beta-N-acetylglucosaminidase [Flavobacteriaceae bacterium CG_4_8_14_3_um_filter_34_10]|nr:MAG: beta-N-acetylglucosaminidase [Flavobacteriaceae bacterium CG18_big_fil_WC_8_21_14_2_50_34_36]PIX09991.1 MAG: beta-N-acetylglucosaminidase [Flavobacteriaceae bacterium CG_4_8_14_3_um_filter_34_10]PIZ07722.1 MAG: beta-N-acetylglucosaminidase [Flavobacteriaceae bacterium CG_4_10_14_0_8_um_filter_34_31]PJC06450.1 MAG: beta-N-acetylglucosaminidase [Flavobacteriaceae bacterium CG_4_9_14_0_8_um_filter_34_30]